MENQEQVTEEQTPVETLEAQTPPKPMSSMDILKRANEPDAIQTQSDKAELAELKTVNLDDIKDPVARQYAERRIKELESGVNKKFEEIAKTRKELEAKLAEVNQPWTPTRIQSLLQDQNFVSSVQELQKTQSPQEWSGTESEWSSLTSEEKQEFEKLRQENQRNSSQLQQILQAQEDAQLKQKYSDYDPDAINAVQQQLLNGTMQATREHLYKVVNFDTAVERAYKLGLQDRNSGLSEKLNVGEQLGNMQVSSSSEPPKEIKEKGLAEVMRWRLSQIKK